MNLGQVQHVVQRQHPWRSLGEVHGRVHVVLQTPSSHQIPSQHQDISNTDEEEEEETDGEAQHLVVLGVHGLPLLRPTSVVLTVKSDSTQLENDISLSLKQQTVSISLASRISNT